MNFPTILNITLAALAISLAAFNLIATVRREKRWCRRLQEASSKLSALMAENHKLDLEKDFLESQNKNLKTELENTKEKLKKAHERIAVLMVEYDRLHKR